jgi:hypothetical protein
MSHFTVNKSVTHITSRVFSLLFIGYKVLSRRRWVVKIRMDLGEVGWSDVDWIGLAQDRNRWRALVNSVLNLGVP